MLQEITILFTGGSELTITKDQANLNQIHDELTNYYKPVVMIQTSDEHISHIIYIDRASIAAIDCSYGTDEQYAQAIAN